MERTYNELIDNGLFIASFYLKKPIETITDEDILSNIDIFTNLLYKHFNNKNHLFKNITYNVFPNSRLANPMCKNKEDLQKSLNIIKEEYIKNKDKDNETCMFCGEDKVIKSLIKERFFSSSLNPYISSNPFYNFSNNLHYCNLCPICAILGYLGLLNIEALKITNKTKKIEIIDKNILILSDNKEFMEDYTKQKQYNNIKNYEKCVLRSDLYKEKVNLYDYIAELFDEEMGLKNIYNCKYISLTNIQNYKGDKIIDEYIINKKYIDLICKLKQKDLYNEFKKSGLIPLISNNQLEYKYIYKLVNYKENKLKCSLQLFKFINKEMNNLDDKIIDIIKDIAFKINTIDEKAINKIKNIDTYNNYCKLLLKWQEEFCNKKQEVLFSTNEYNMLINHIKYKNIINNFKCELIILNLKNKGENNNEK